MADVAVERADCPLCGSTDLRRRAVPRAWIGEAVFGAHRGAFGVTACGGCGFELVNPRPSDALLEAFYGGDDYAHHAPTASPATAARTAHLLDFVAAQVIGRRLLDFGCGGGILLRAARDAGWQVTGHDLGPAAIAACHSQGLAVTADVATLPVGGFDAVVMSHVLEHVTACGPTLAAVRRLLAPGGRVVIEVPNVGSLRARLSHPTLIRWARFDERYRAFPIHLSYFTPRTLARMVERSGLEVVRVETWGFGVEELRVVTQAEVTHQPRRQEQEQRHGPRTRGRGRKLAKAVMSALILDRGLGENVVMVAR